MYTKSLEIDKVVEAAMDSVSYYRELPPDFVLCFNSDTLKNEVWGHVGSAIHFASIVANGEEEAYEFCSFGAVPSLLKKAGRSSIKVLNAAFPDNYPLLLQNVRQEGSCIWFEVEVNGIILGTLSLKSAHFQDVRVMDVIGSNSKRAWPVVKAVAKLVAEHLVAPFAVEVMSQQVPC